MHRVWMVAMLAWPLCAAERLTLREAEQRALSGHPQLEAARYQQAAAAEIPKAIRSRLYPQAFGATSGALAEDSNTRILAGGFNNPIILNRLGIGVGGSQLISDFGRTKHYAGSASLRADALAEATKVTRADVLLRVDRAYYQALRAQAVLQVAEQTVKARTLVATQTTTLASNKLKSELDVTFARVNLEEARLLESSARSDARSAMVDLTASMGLQDAPEYELVEEPTPPELGPDWGAVVAEALKNRPELQQARLDEQASAELVKAERAMVLPTLSLFASTGVAPFHNERLQNHWNAGGINIDIPILNGGLFKARRAEAEARQKASAQVARDVVIRVTREVRLAWLSAANAFERLQLTASLLQQATQALKLAQARYDLGLSSIIELSQAQLNLTRAQIAQASARFEYQALRAMLEYQKGTL